jgi:NIMA (never in mitosis gene a)-related kinase
MIVLMYIHVYPLISMQIPEDTIWQVTSQILLALHECHEGRVVKNPVDNSESRVIILHRDLKPDNSKLQ